MESAKAEAGRSIWNQYSLLESEVLGVYVRAAGCSLYILPLKCLDMHASAGHIPTACFLL
jgi:hypothetical protein